MLIREGNAFYEIDDACMKDKQKEEKKKQPEKEKKDVKKAP